MDFTKYTSDDHLYLLTEGYKHLAIVPQAYEASVDTLKYWTMLANCNACTIPGQTFEDLFPADKVAQYRDLQGKPLDELTFEFALGSAPKKVFCEASQLGGRIEYQLDYVRWYLIPRFAATVVNLFSGLIYSYRNELGGEMGEPPKPAAPGSLQERFLQAAAELNAPIEGETPSCQAWDLDGAST